MKLLIGLVAIIMLVLGDCFLIFLNYQQQAYEYAIPIALWTLILIFLAFRIRLNSKNAFFVILVFYVSSVIIKNIVLGGEYILPLIFHAYFVVSMLIGMKGTIEEFNRFNSKRFVADKRH